MTLARERDQWFWVACGPKAVAMCRACADRARQEGRPDIAAAWDRSAQSCIADPTSPLKIKLPQEYVERRINQPRYFNGPPWYKHL
jgi:hypothetical protein